MTSHEVRKAMSQYWRIRKELKAKENAMMEIRSKAEKMTPSFSQTPGGHGETASRVEHYAVQLVEMQEDLEDATEALLVAMRKAQRMIELAPDPLQRAALTEYHLNGKTAEETAASIGYSERQIFRLMGSAYEYIAKMMS